MSIRSDVLNELTRLAAQGSFGGLEVVSLMAPEGVLTARLPAVDRLACSLETLTLETPKLAGASIDDLKQLSSRLAKQLNYLLEPISLIESDAETCTVQLRSSPPAKDEDQTSYYEIVARRGGSLTLCRYSKQPGDARQIIPAHLTHEVLARLAQDMVDVLP